MNFPDKRNKELHSQVGLMEGQVASLRRIVAQRSAHLGQTPAVVFAL